ncbi:MAG: hypothetical protein J5780_02130, partial [Treponema sp.]|nr:hypothetical protein [Treponema sp.]
MSSQFLAITGVFVIIFNLVMWIVFAVKFKKIFSTEDTITEVRNNINELEKSLYQNFTRVIDIADDKIKKLKSVSAEAERRIQEY